MEVQRRVVDRSCRVRVFSASLSASTRTSLCGPDMNAFAHQAHSTLHTTPLHSRLTRRLCAVCYASACRQSCACMLP